MPIYNRSHITHGASGIILNARDLSLRGPILKCEIRLDVDRASVITAEGKPLPPSVQGDLLIDTGASMTCVDKKILEGLGIPPVGDTQVRTPSGSAVQQVYPCGIAFPGAGIPSLERMFVIGADLDGQKIIGLLGRDLLAGALLVYNGIGGSWSLSV